MGDDRALVEAAKSDPSRFAELYEIHFERIYAFIARRVRDRDAAEDLTSEVFHSALANLRQWEWKGKPFAAWLFRSAANAVSDHAARTGREDPIPEALESHDAGIEEAQERSRLFESVRELAEDQRRVLELRFVEGQSIREVAQAMGRSEGAIKQLQFRALDNLRARVGEAHG